MVELIDDVQHEIGRQHVGITLCASLSIDGACHLRQVRKKVKAVDEEGEVAMKDASFQPYVPHHVGGVEARGFISPATEDGEVGVEAEVPGERNACREPIVVVPGADAREVAAVAREAVVASAQLDAYPPFVLRVVSGDLFTQIEVADDAQCVGGGTLYIGHVDIVVEGVGGVAAPREAFLLAELPVEAQTAVGAPVAVDIGGRTVYPPVVG